MNRICNDLRMQKQREKSEQQAEKQTLHIDCFTEGEHTKDFFKCNFEFGSLRFEFSTER
jgi:hypothetical protein